MKDPQILSAKILQHSTGMGLPTPDLVRERAQELAEIEGRREINENDWRNAKQEMHGGHADGLESDDEMAQSSSLGEPAVGSLGHHRKNLGPDDDHVLEELVAEGLDEAEHDRMLAAVRQHEIMDHVEESEDA